ncbi:MAG: ion channel DMI1, partial [Oligoflexales bacterium]
MTKIWNKFKFTLERFVLRGPFFRLLIVISLIVAISFIGGGVVHIFGNHFESVWEAAWWAFLRLSDPGYLGDDRGTLLVTVSTIITVAGCVVFLGAMV